LHPSVIKTIHPLPPVPQSESSDRLLDGEPGGCDKESALCAEEERETCAGSFPLFARPPSRS